MSERILLFVPCYNCAPQIGRVLAQLRGEVGGRIAQALVLDNGSTDGTLERAAAAACEAGRPITLARNHSNYHLGGSHKAAFAFAAEQGFSHVVVLHGDDQGHLDDAAQVLARGEHLAHDACLGARFMPGSSLEGYSAVRRAGNAAFNLFFSAVTGRTVHDLGAGLNVFGRAVFADPQVFKASDDMRFNVYLLLGLIDGGKSSMFFPISWREADQVSNVRLASQSARTLAIAWEYLTRREAFRTTDHRDAPVERYAFDVIAEVGHA
jgi:glycosyltransferase involved in cell wall biosynthesis